MVETTAPTRRVRLREQTRAEIKQHALQQLAEGGPQAVSLNAIARAIGTTGPALYRYFASRDELIAEVVAEGYDDLADALEQAVSAAGSQEPAARPRAVAAAYREWALAHPHRYRLMLGSTYGSGQLAPERVVPASHRSMTVLLDSLSGMPSDAGEISAHGAQRDPAQQSSPEAGAPDTTTLGEQLARWARSRAGGGEQPVGTLLLGVLGFTRLHGVVSLEIEGVLASMGIDPALLYDAEVEELIAPVVR